MKKDMLERITTDISQCGGKLCIRGMRVRVSDVLELLAAGLCPDQIISEELPYLEKDDITACLQYAARKINHPVLSAA